MWETICNPRSVWIVLTAYFPHPEVHRTPIISPLKLAELKKTQNHSGQQSAQSSSPYYLVSTSLWVGVWMQQKSQRSSLSKRKTDREVTPLGSFRVATPNNTSSAICHSLIMLYRCSSSLLRPAHIWSPLIAAPSIWYRCGRTEECVKDAAKLPKKANFEQCWNRWLEFGWTFLTLKFFRIFFDLVNCPNK